MPVVQDLKKRYYEYELALFHLGIQRRNLISESLGDREFIRMVGEWFEINDELIARKYDIDRFDTYGNKEESDRQRKVVDELEPRLQKCLAQLERLKSPLS